MSKEIGEKQKMTERRPLVETLDRDTEEHFIKTGTLPGDTRPGNLKIAPEPTPIEQSLSLAESYSAATSRRRPRESKATHPVARVPVTLRFLPEIAGALKRASLERELDGLEPHTQQDIAEAALEPWLRREGYLKA